jgi:tetratricopeptide (TPR) repeat protein
LKIHPHETPLEQLLPLETRPQGNLTHLSPDYDAAIARVREELRHRTAALARERAEAPGLLLELTGHAAEQREMLLGNSPRFHTWGLFELLVDRSGEAGITDPVRAEELGLLALRVSGHLDLSYHRADLTEDLRARAWAYIGNARRMRCDLQGAEAAFRLAAAHLKSGSREPVERAVLLDLQASLLRAQRRFEEAARLLDRAVRIFLHRGERHRAGRSLVNLSTVLNYGGRPEETIPVLLRALELIDPEEEPRLVLCARHNLIFVLAELGRAMEAQDLYRKARPLYRDFPDAWTQNRRKWVRGKIARGLGQLGTAEALFRAARDGFVAEGVPYDTALISLELAALYAGQGRAAELRRLAEEMVPIFASRQIHREALAALAFFRQAVEAEHAGLEVIARVAAYLRRAQHDPAQSFEEAVEEPA